MKIMNKNRVYGIEEEVDGLKISGDLVLDRDCKATVNGKVKNESGEFGGSVYFQEMPDGQVSMSFSGSPECGAQVMSAVQKTVAEAKVLVDKPATEEKQDISEPVSPSGTAVEAESGAVG